MDDDYKAWLFLFLVGLVVALPFVVWHWTWKADRDAGRDAMVPIANTLDAAVGEDGYYLPGDGPAVDDRWGTPLEYQWWRGGAIERVDVLSAGPDREWGTGDDIRVTRRNVVPYGVGRGVSRPARQGLRGMWDQWREDRKEDDDGNE